MVGKERVLSELGLGTARRGGVWGPEEPRVTGLSVDSRTTKRGELFAALPGTEVHGAEFISYAIRMGAAAILTDEAGLELAERKLGAVSIPVLVDNAPRRALAHAAARWYAAQPETMVAVTGTNGKTSVATFVRQIWEALDLRAVNLGTTGVHGAVSASISHTTPEPITLHALLADLAAQGVSHASMEASSHGLAQSRLDGVNLSAAAFTNITRDHMDYHAEFTDYFAAKLDLFDRVLTPGGTAVVNMDDPFGARVRKIAEARGQQVIGVGRSEKNELRLLDMRFDASGLDLRFSWQNQPHLLRLALIGGFQGHNALMAAGLVIASGSDPAAVFKVLGGLQTVRGRMELAATRSHGATVFVDYAHTPDALATAMNALRPHVMGRLIVVFGAGGDRDRGKRPLMGRAAVEGADVVFVTDDNPRNENPASIRAEIMAACPEATEIGDRAEAILAAVDALQPGDTLLIAGKGHETGQIVGQDIYPFDDIEQASVAVAALDGLGA